MKPRFSDAILYTKNDHFTETCLGQTKEQALKKWSDVFAHRIFSFESDLAGGGGNSSDGTPLIRHVIRKSTVLPRGSGQTILKAEKRRRFTSWWPRLGRRVALQPLPWASAGERHRLATALRLLLLLVLT